MSKAGRIGLAIAGGAALVVLSQAIYAQSGGYQTVDGFFKLPDGRKIGSTAGITIDPDGTSIWAFERCGDQFCVGSNAAPILKFDATGKLVKSLGAGMFVRPHGIYIDRENNIWVTDGDGPDGKDPRRNGKGHQVFKLSPEGKLLMTIGVSGRRGDWNEAKGQRLLWQPVMVTFAPNGDVYIGQGHANESPNDADSDDPVNSIGAARIIHLDKDGRFINQWYGNEVGQGKFSSAHGLAVDPKTGDVWIGDREEYRIVIYSGDGKFLKTIQMRNLVCALYFDSHGEPWMATGQDGQFLKLDRNGKVLGAIGKGMGIEPGQFIEASYWVFDRANNLYAGDTSVGRITKMIAPGK